MHIGGDTSASVSYHGGGAAANVATWLSYVGVEAHLASRIGDDENGRRFALEVSDYNVTFQPKPARSEITGVVIVIVDSTGERTMFPDSAANSGLSLNDLPELDGFDAVFLSGYALINPASRPEVLKMLRIFDEKKIPVIIDPGTVGAFKEIPLDELHDWLSHAELLILNVEEALFLSHRDNVEDALKVLNNLCGFVVVKRGAAGAMAINEAGRLSSVSAVTAEVIDTTGAGDAFDAGFIKEWINGQSLDAALTRAAGTAAIALAKVGARPPLNGS